MARNISHRRNEKNRGFHLIQTTPFRSMNPNVIIITTFNVIEKVSSLAFKCTLAHTNPLSVSKVMLVFVKDGQGIKCYICMIFRIPNATPLNTEIGQLTTLRRQPLIPTMKLCAKMHLKIKKTSVTMTLMMTIYLYLLS